MSDLQMPKKRTGQTSVSVEESTMKARNFVGNPIDTDAANAHQQRRSVSSPISPVAVVSFMTTTDGETPQTTPVRIEYSVDQIDAMQNGLANARDAGEFPRNTLNYTGFANLIEDYQRLQHLQNLRRGLSPEEASQEWRTAFVDTARELADRDAATAEHSRNARIENNVHGIIERENRAADSYNMRLHTAVQAVRLATGNAQASVINMSAIQNEIRTAVQNMALQGTHGVQTSNMDDVFEEIFGIIESSLLDATGPLRLNTNRLDQNATRLGGELDNMTTQVGAMTTQVGAMTTQVGAMTTQVGAMTTQVGAMNNHVSAVGNHVSALGALIHAVNNTTMSTNNQAQHLSTQVCALQQVLNVIPAMVQEAVERVLPEVLIPALVGALKTSAKGAGGKEDSLPTIYTKEMTGDASSPRKTKKSCLFSRLFGTHKSGSRKDGNGGSTGMAC